MTTTALTPENTTIVLVDHAVGFANVLRSHSVAEHLNNVIGLAKTAVNYASGLVVTNGLSTSPSGPLYPQLRAVLEDRPVIERPGFFNSFLDEDFAAAVRATGRENVVVAGVSTEGCVLQTVLGGQREGYRMHVAVDASASVTVETHSTAVMRMVQAGVVPLTWYSLAGEFQVDRRRPTGAIMQTLMAEHQPELSMGVHNYLAAKGHGVAAAQAG